MKKLKYISLLVLLLSLGNVFSQSREQILDELSELLKSQSNPSELFYVESEGFLDIHGHQVKLYWATLRYEESNGPMLAFNCKSGFQCIYDPKAQKEMSNFAFSMKDKKGVYQAIELINKIEKSELEAKINLDALMGGYDKGKVTGDPNASGYYGIGGDGSGGNYRLGNRKALSKPKPNYPCNEEGKIVVAITVDQSGKVISAQAGVTGTTNSAPCLLKEAKEAALKTRFIADSKAPSKQFGEIIYNFSLSE